MLNEAYELWQTLERCHISFEDYVPGFDRCKEEDGIRVFLALDNRRKPAGVRIEKLEFVLADHMRRLRKCNLSGAGITLPVFNFEPLHEVTAEDSQALDKEFRRWAEGKGDATKFRHVLNGTATAIAWEGTKVDKLQDAFTTVSHRLKLLINTDSDIRGDGWRKLVELLPLLEAENFLSQLSSAVCNHIASAHAEFKRKVWLQLLKGKAIQVQFEPSGTAKMVCSEEAQAWLKDLWQKAISSGTIAAIKKAKPSAKRDAGKQRKQHKGRTDQPEEAEATKLKPVWGAGDDWHENFSPMPVQNLGMVSLFSQNHETKPTSARYASGGTINFRVGSDIRAKLMGAIEWLTDDKRDGQTWSGRTLPNGRNFMLLAYPSEMPKSPPHLSAMFCGGTAAESARAELRFQELAEEVVVALDGILKKAAKPGAVTVNVFALHKPDRGRAQVFFTESFNAKRLRELAAAWRDDSQNLPSMEIPQFPRLDKEEQKRRKKEKISTPPENFSPLIPFPYEVVECLNTVWQRCQKAEDANFDITADAALADAFQLLRWCGAEADIEYLGRILELAVRRATPLLLAVGQAAHRQGGRVFAPPKASLKAAFQSLRWPSIFSLLLTRLNFRLEHYMHEPAFLIGRMLSLVDSLHSHYAKYVSGKDQLPQLLGNSLMPLALERPQEALELLGQRILPYQAWAYSFANGKDTFAEPEKRAAAESVGKILGAIGKVAAELAGRVISEENLAELPAREGHEKNPPAKTHLDLAYTLRANDFAWSTLNSAAKAQMLIGYLYRPPKKPSPGTGPQTKSGELTGFPAEATEA